MTITPAQQRLMELFKCTAEEAQEMIDQEKHKKNLAWYMSDALDAKPEQVPYYSSIWALPYGAGHRKLSEMLAGNRHERRRRVVIQTSDRSLRPSSIYDELVGNHNLELKMGGTREDLKITPEELKQAGMEIWDEVHPEDDV